MNKLTGLFLLMLVLGGCNNEPRLFEILPPGKSGIDFENTLVENDSLNILDYLYFYNGGGVAMGDINNDGLPDLFFTSNQNANKLYLNKGKLKFQDITETAGLTGNSSWNTGAAMADINGDGWLDIYVTAVVGINNFKGHNELYINNGDNTFTERSKDYGLDFQAYGTTSTFFDYDLDGDLDLFILNHAVHTEESFGRAKLRETRNEKTGDRLLKNEGSHFTDVSESAGIYGGINGYGLGISISDFNLDGYPDIYVGNDFHEDDYFYLNNGDGTFTERLRDFFGHTSRFSMGNDVADINEDGLPDLISLDMAPEDEVVLKSSEGDDTYQTLKMRTQQYGYHYQFTRNMLFTGNPNAPFTETGIASGIASTDWSWSALFGDYNQDGHQDLFISNGIPKRPNDLDFIRFVSSDAIQKKMNDNRLVDQEAMELMPSGAVSNYVFKGNGTGQFSDETANWIPKEKGYSGATAVGDLDGDGDLDIVTSNINAPAGVYVNTTNKARSFLQLKLKYKYRNPFGVGTKVYAYHRGKTQFKELFPNRGWQASSAPVLHFGFGDATVIDSVKVIWPDMKFQVLRKVTANQVLELSPTDTAPYSYGKKAGKRLFSKTNDNLGITYVHKEDNHTDFDYQKLIPYEVSDRGPAVAVGDIDHDGKDDIFFGGAKNQKAEIYLQKLDSFQLRSSPEIDNDSVYEDVTAEIVTLDSNSEIFILIGTGGNRISPSLQALENRSLYEENGSFKLGTLDEFYNNTSVIAAKDLAEDTVKLFIGNHSTPMDFGKVPASHYVFEGDLEPLNLDPGMVTDAIWDDFNNDGEEDLIVVGEWMKPQFFTSNKGKLERTTVVKEEISGLWQRIIPFDIDGDGDKDYLLGNWGLNSKFKASREFPMKMYYADFDENGTTETILAIEKNGAYYPLLGLNELAEQLVFLRKRFPNYKDFAGKSIEEVIGPELLQKAKVFEVSTLSSGFLRNTNNTFTFEEFPSELQTAPIKAFVKYDFDGDGKESVLVGGNYFGVIPFHGRFDSFSGALIRSENNIELGNRLGLEMEHKSVRHLKVIQLNNKPYLLIVYNNEAAEIYEILE